MAYINNNYLNIKESYLFSEIAMKVNKFQAENPDADIIRMGIGDVPFPKAVIKAMRKRLMKCQSRRPFAATVPSRDMTFKKRCLRLLCRANIKIANDEVFISDGAKSDLANILDILGIDNVVMVTDPVIQFMWTQTLWREEKYCMQRLRKKTAFCPCRTTV